MLELVCAALIVFYEARGESWEGQVAVASVVWNRVYDDRWPSNACEVMNQPRQFEFLEKASAQAPIGPSWEKALAAASYAREPTHNYHFFNTSYGKIKLGNHWFR